MSPEGNGTVNQRLSEIIDAFERGAKSSFATKIGVTAQSIHDLIGGRKGTPSFKMLSSILENYPQVNARWLILGQESMLISERSRNQSTHHGSALSPEQFEVVRREMKDLVISTLGLGPAEERRIKANKARAEQITALDIKTMRLKGRLDELTAQIQAVEDKGPITEKAKKQLDDMRDTRSELAKEWGGSMQVLLTLQAEEKHDLRESHYLVSEMTQAVQAALKAST